MHQQLQQLQQQGHHAFPPQYLPTQPPSLHAESQQQLAANDKAAYAAQRLFREQNPHSPEADRPMGPSRATDDCEHLFDDLEAVEAPGDALADEAAATSSSSTAVAPAETADQIIARVRPPPTPVPRADQIGTFKTLAHKAPTPLLPCRLPHVRPIPPGGRS